MPSVTGEIETKWLALGGPNSILGAPVTDEEGTPDGVGRFNHFEHGSIYWTPNTGAHEIHGLIHDHWTALGFERSVVGYPITDEEGTPDGVGRFNHFQNGSIYWTPGTGAFEVNGFIREKWASLGFEKSNLGYPLTDETSTPDGIGRFNHFQGGSIYWTPQTGAHFVFGAIRDKWAGMGFERSVLGYPTADLQTLPNEEICQFQHGALVWDLTVPVNVQVFINRTQNPTHSPPSQDQLNRIGQAIEEALAETFTVLPIGDEGNITVDTMNFDDSTDAIHFHVTIHYKQSGVPGFLGQVIGPLYDFTTFYQGDIAIQDPVGSVEQTQYGFETPDIPGIGVRRIGFNAPEIIALANVVGAILAA